MPFLKKKWIENRVFQKNSSEKIFRIHKIRSFRFYDYRRPDLHGNKYKKDNIYKNFLY